MNIIETLEFEAQVTLDMGGDVKDAELLMRSAGVIRKLYNALSDVMRKAPGYDWNADPDNLTLLTGAAFSDVAQDLP